MIKYKYGVSPAYLISLFGDTFTPNDVVSALKGIKQLGFDEFQCELVKDEYFPLWENGGAISIAQEARKLGLTISQIVAHFMLENFKNKETLFSDTGISEMERLANIIQSMGYSGQVTLPIGPYEGLSSLNSEEKRVAIEQLRFKVGKISSIVENHGCFIALEVQPKSLICGGKGILSFCESIGETIKYNYDTGHAWASGENEVAEYPMLFKNRLAGTHLCDNNSIVNLSLALGQGTIDWNVVFRNLIASGYNGGFDLEIFTTAEKVKSEYGKALDDMKEYIENYSNI